MAVNWFDSSSLLSPYTSERSVGSCAGPSDSDVSTCDTTRGSLLCGAGHTCDSLPSIDDEDVQHAKLERSIATKAQFECKVTLPEKAHHTVSRPTGNKPLAGVLAASATHVKGSLAQALCQHALPSAPVQETRPELSMFGGSVRRIRFLGAEGAIVAERFVHEAVLNKLPYFEAMLARWDCGDAGDVRLPGGGRSAVPVDALLKRLYSSKAHWTAGEWGRVVGPGLAAACDTLLLAKFLLSDDMARELVPLLRQRTPDEQSRAWIVASGITRDVAELQDYIVDAADSLCMASVIDSFDGMTAGL